MSGGGDYTRFTFDPAEDHSGVWMQQGRVTLDADWNELADIIDRRFRATTMDTIGRCTVPRQTPEGFRIEIAGGDLTIGRGRLYADGLLAENHGAGDLELDTSLGELRASDPVRYGDQPYFPNAATAAPLPSEGGPFLAYVDVWRREITYLEEPDLMEKAVGVDSATRLQTAWQVRVFEPTEDVPGGLTCETLDEDIPGWPTHIAPSAGRLTTAAVGVPDSDDPCEIPPNAGYRGAENRLYRVETHDSGPLGTATFKWSRDNASVATAVTGLNAAEDQLTVVRTRRDEVLRFSTDDWIEVSDDWHEFAGDPGVMRKVLSVDDVAQTITLTAALPAAEFDPTDASRHTRVRRWDQKGQVRDALGTVVGDVDSMGGVIQVPTGGTGILLEDGVEVTFSDDPAGGSFRVADHWAFAARTADASVEELVEAPPRAIHHHYCRLAVVEFPGTVIDDCRTLWPSEFEGGESCDCDVCVTAESHNSGQLTIQHAIDQVKETGGRVCLESGLYRLEAPVKIAGARSVDLRGKGWTTLLLHLGAGPVIDVERSLGVTIEEMALISSAIGPKTEAAMTATPSFSSAGGFGIALLNNADVTVRRCAIAQLGPIRAGEAGAAVSPLLGVLSATGPAIAIGGFLIKGSIAENVMVAGFGVLGVSAADPREFTVATTAERLAYVATAQLTIEDNLMLCARAGVSFVGASAHLAETRLAGNLVAGCRSGGIVMLGAVLGRAVVASHLEIRGNTLRTLGDAIVVGTDDTRIEDNDAAGAARGLGGDGIVLGSGFGRKGIARCIVRGNRITGVGGMAIAIRERVSQVAIEDNLLQGASRGGIVMGPEATGGDLAIADNQVYEIEPREESKGSAIAGILVVRARRVRVVDNAVIGVGTRSGVKSRIGIQVIASDSVLIARNEVADIGPEAEFANDAAGIEVIAPFNHVDVTDNVVRRSGVRPSTPDSSRWWAIRIRPVVKRLVTSEAILVDVAKGVLLITDAVILRLSRGREVVRVRGNSADLYGIVPAIQIGARGACVVSDNRCLLATDRAVVVDVSGGAAIAMGNYLEGLVQIPVLPAMTLSVGGGPFTVLGNIASGPIEVNGAGLPSPWTALNVETI